MDPPDALFSVQDVSFDIPEEEALAIAKDSPITFSGRIESVSGFLQASIIIHLEDTEWTIESEEE